MSDGGKGSGRRPGKMPDDAWERTFGKKQPEESCDEYCSTHGCNQGRNCPVRIDRVMQAKQKLDDKKHNWLDIVFEVAAFLFIGFIIWVGVMSLQTFLPG